MPRRGHLGRRYLRDRPGQVHRLRHLRRRLPERSDQARIILQEGIKKLFPRKEELFYCLFPNGSADTPETRGRSTHTACRRSGIHNSFPAYFNGRSRFRRPLIRYAPKHPRKGFRGKIETHRTVAGLWQDIERHVCRDFSANEPFRLQNLSIILNLEHRNIAEEA